MRNEDAMEQNGQMNNISRSNYALGVLSNWTFLLPFKQVKVIIHANLLLSVEMGKISNE